MIILARLHSLRMVLVMLVAMTVFVGDDDKDVDDNHCLQANPTLKAETPGARPRSYKGHLVLQLDQILHFATL